MQEQEDNQQEQEEEVGVKLTPRDVGLGIATFAAFGGYDLLANTGLGGFVLATAAGIVATYFGEELITATQKAVALLPRHKSAKRALPTSERRALPKLLTQSTQVLPEQEIDDYEEGENEDINDEEDTPGIFANDMRKALHLAENLQPDVDEWIGEGIVGFGIKGSGKTSTCARLAEEFGKFRVPMVIFDMEGDYVSLVRWLPMGMLATVGQVPTGQEILRDRLQVVFDLQSWNSDEEAALMMCEVIAQLKASASACSPEKRVPCLVFLDEAEYWLPQEQNVSYLTKETIKLLFERFHFLATRGRKRGLTPCLFTQRIAKINKNVIGQMGINILMRATLDNDITRYMEYVNEHVVNKEQIAAFQKGEAVVRLADGLQLVTRFYPRQSRHVSHTPHVDAVLERFEQQQRQPRAYQPMEDLTPNPARYEYSPSLMASRVASTMTSARPMASNGVHQPGTPLDAQSENVSLPFELRSKVSQVLDMDAQSANQNDIIKQVWNVEPDSRAGRAAKEELKMIRASIAEHARKTMRLEKSDC